MEDQACILKYCLNLENIVKVVRDVTNDISLSDNFFMAKKRFPKMHIHLLNYRVGHLTGHIKVWQCPRLIFDTPNYSWCKKIILDT